MNTTTLRVLVLLLAIAAIYYAGWWCRGVVADRDTLQYQQAQAVEAAKQRTEAAKVDAANEANTQESSKRLDVTEPAREQEIRYVVQQVIQYRDRPDAGKCVLPPEWVRIYNQAGASPKLP